MTALLLLLAVWAAFNIGGWEAKDNLCAIGAALKFWQSEADEHVDRLIWETHEREFCWPRLLLRFFYCAKAIICLLLGRWGYGNYRDSVEVAAWNIRPLVGEYSGSEWSALWVGQGVFTGWRYYTERDQSA